MNISETPMIPGLVDALLDDIGIGVKGTPEALKVRAATKEYCLLQIEHFTRAEDTISWGELNEIAGPFNDGYMSALTGIVKEHN